MADNAGYIKANSTQDLTGQVTSYEFSGDAMNRKMIAARFQLLSTDEGGRAGPLLSGYRSLLRFEGTNTDFGFELHLDPAMGASGVEPGASGRGRFSFWAVEELPVLSGGQKFELREGTRVVGHGVIEEPTVGK